MAAGEDTSHILSGLTNQLPDRDPEETAEWVESLDALIREQGTERAQYIMRSLLQRAGAQSVGVPMVTTTDYVNTIPVDQEAEFPGNEEFERRYLSGELELELGARARLIGSSARSSLYRCWGLAFQVLIQK